MQTTLKEFLSKAQKIRREMQPAIAEVLKYARARRAAAKKHPRSFVAMNHETHEVVATGRTMKMLGKRLRNVGSLDNVSVMPSRLLLG